MLNPAIDSGREFYIPYRMLCGDVLYKDIFNIYGPLAYQINQFAYSVLGINIHALRVFGVCNLLLIICAVRLILKEFFTEKDKVSFFFKDFSILNTVFFAFIAIVSVSSSIFNFIIPYSYAMTYGLCLFLFSLYFFIKFSKTDLPKFAYLACFFAGGAFCCKYEFI